MWLKLPDTNEEEQNSRFRRTAGSGGRGGACSENSHIHIQRFSVSETPKTGKFQIYSWLGWGVWSAWRCLNPFPAHRGGPWGSLNTD